MEGFVLGTVTVVDVLCTLGKSQSGLGLACLCSCQLLPAMVM